MTKKRKEKWKIKYDTMNIARVGTDAAIDTRLFLTFHIVLHYLLFDKKRFEKTEKDLKFELTNLSKRGFRWSCNNSMSSIEKPIPKFRKFQKFYLYFKAAYLQHQLGLSFLCIVWLKHTFRKMFVEKGNLHNFLTKHNST